MIVIIPQADEIEIILVHQTDTLDDDLPGDDWSADYSVVLGHL